MMFKYQEEIDRLSIQCPPSTWQSKKMLAFRFVFQIPHENTRNNFLPVLIIKPKRKLNPDTDANRCKGYALSLFDTERNAKRRYNNLVKKRPRLREQLGDSLAKGFLEEQDGVVSDVDRNGHFNLHEFKNVDLSRKFMIVSDL